MGETVLDLFRYSHVVVLAFGILGNILVIISILRPKKVLKNNYYFVVLHLAICDLGALIIHLLDHINRILVEELLGNINDSPKYCVFFGMLGVFQVAGIGMMLIISALRYRAVVHPLKPAISRRKLKVVCAFVYIVCFVAGCGPILPLCFIQDHDVIVVYNKVYLACFITCIFFFPTIFMAAVYYKIGRALIKQNKYMKSVCSNPVRHSASSSSFNILKFIRNRRTFFVCICTVLCYGVANIPYSVRFVLYMTGGYELFEKTVWLGRLANVLSVAGLHSINPLIYGIFDKKLLTFWKLCRQKKPRPNEN